jgi:hypothetical protein
MYFYTIVTDLLHLCSKLLHVPMSAHLSKHDFIDQPLSLIGLCAGVDAEVPAVDQDLLAVGVAPGERDQIHNSADYLLCPA